MFELDLSASDKSLLSHFVIALKRLLLTISHDGYGALAQEPTSLRIIPELLEYAQDATGELVEQGHVERLLAAIETTELENLGLHGLTGQQLRFKLQTIHTRETRFRLIPWLWNLRRLIDTIDNLLDSIIKAVGAGDAVKELKDALFAATEDENTPHM